MADPGQHENLKEVLGFDPNDSDDSMPRPKDERYGWPENWKELFKEDSERKFAHFDAEAAMVDEKNLFAVHKDKDGAVTRTYYRFVDRERIIGRNQHFDEYSSVLIKPYSKNQEGMITFNTDFESGKNSFAIFYTRENKLTGIEFSSNDARDLRVTYFSDGELSHFALSTEVLMPDPDDPDEMPEYDHTGIYVGKKDGKWRVQSDHAEKWRRQVIDEADETLTLISFEHDKEVDTIVVPLKINPYELLAEWLPSDLRRNPTTENVNFDEAWKGKDFLHEVGTYWESVADDSLHSLTPIPPPAPEDQK